MTKIEFLKGDKIGFPITPSIWLPDMTYEPVTQIIISYGGGMGGISQTEIVKRQDDIQPNTIQEFTRTDGKRIRINTSYIVYAENFVLVQAKFETTNPHFKGVHECKYLVEEGVVCKLVSKPHKDI